MTFAPEARLAVCLPSLRLGGAERVALNLIEGLLERGYRVDAVAADANGPLAADVPAGAERIDLGAPRMAQAIGPLVRYLRRARPAAVISHVHHLNLAVSLARSWVQAPCRLLLVEHNTLGEKARGGQVRIGLRSGLRWAYTRRGVGLVAVSHGVAESLACELRLPRESIHVVANPVIGARSARLLQAAPAHPWAQDPGAPLVLAVGRLVPQKDVATLLAAFARLRLRREARLVILGDGPLRAELQAQRDRLACAADVDFAGQVANPWPYYRAASVTALSSRFEGLPTVLIEALASGSPVVATDCPSGPREILDGGRYGLLAPVGDAEALAAALDQALGRRWDRAALAARGAEFSVSRATDGYLSLLRGSKAQAA